MEKFATSATIRPDHHPKITQWFSDERPSPTVDERNNVTSQMGCLSVEELTSKATTDVWMETDRHFSYKFMTTRSTCLQDWSGIKNVSFGSGKGNWCYNKAVRCPFYDRFLWADRSRSLRSAKIRSLFGLCDREESTQQPDVTTVVHGDSEIAVMRQNTGRNEPQKKWPSGWKTKTLEWLGWMEICRYYVRWKESKQKISENQSQMSKQIYKTEVQD